MGNEAFYQFLKLKNRSFAALKYLTQSSAIESMPQWVSFQNTHICNLRCPHCQTHGTAAGRKHCNDRRLNMDMAMIERVAQEVLPFADEFTLTLTGEPLASPDLEAILRVMAPFGAKMDLITNGTLLTPERLRLLIPLLKRVRISVDGATRRTFESIRQGAGFHQVLNNIKLLTSTCRRFPKRLRSEISLSYTIMGSNIHELPAIVDVAAEVGVSMVKGAYVQIFYPELLEESVEMYKPLYNACRAEAYSRAEKRGIVLDLPDPFPGIQPDRFFRAIGTKMIVPSVASDCRELNSEPPPWLDVEKLRLESGALWTYFLEQKLIDEFDPLFHPLMARLKKLFPFKPESLAFKILWMLAFSGQMVWVSRIVRNLLMISRLIPYIRRSPSGNPYQAMEEIQSRLDREVKCYRDLLESISGDYEQKIRYCDYLHRCAYIFPSGDVSPCCVVGAPVLGNLKERIMRDVWNGDAYNDFRNRFYSDSPYLCCKGCKFVTTVSVGVLLNQIPFVHILDGTSLLSSFPVEYNYEK